MMNKHLKKALCLTTLAGTLACNTISPGAKASGGETHIFFTSSTHGYFDSCG